MDWRTSGLLPLLVVGGRMDYRSGGQGTVLIVIVHDPEIEKRFEPYTYSLYDKGTYIYRTGGLPFYRITYAGGEASLGSKLPP